MSKEKKILYHTVWAKDMPDSVLQVFWGALQKGDVARLTFYDCMFKNAEEFCLWARRKNQTLRFVVAENATMKILKNITNENIHEYFRAMYWLNNFIGKGCMIHFAFLKNAFDEQEEVGQYVVQGLLCTKDAKGDFVLDALLGVTPCVYRHAIEYIKKLGFSCLGILPNACFFERKNSYKNAVLSILTRDCLWGFGGDYLPQK